jgi:EAL domain-containing protein (putative c-di-GMP-specific phosphodiesterase class I)
MAEAIASVLKPSIRIAGRDIYVTASTGISITNAAATQAGDLLRGADIAMYEAKRLGGARYAIFDPRRMEQAWRMYGLQGDLRQAIDNGELTLVYQPLVDLEDMAIRQVEALVRWSHPKRGDLSPAEFIPLAESSGLVILLGEWVLEQACRQLRQWQVNDPARAEWSIAVNISAKQLAHPHLVETVRTILTETGLDPATLELEITESAVVDDMETAKRTLRALKELGLRLAIDDFGAGYAGLGYLRDWDVDALKIDKSYISGLGQSPEDTAMIRAVLDVAASLGLDVTAEGVETEEQARLLREMGCTRGQGFIFGRPVHARDVPNAIARGDFLPV